MKRSGLLKLLGVAALLAAIAAWVILDPGMVCQSNGHTECRSSDPTATVFRFVVSIVLVVGGLALFVFGLATETDE